MNNQDLLRPPFSYSLTPLIFILLGIGILLWILLKPKKKEETPIIIKPPTKNLFEIKNRYQQEIQVLIENINNNKITNRKAYQSLSMLIRSFIFEVTQIKVQNYSLQEIKKVGIDSLTELVEEYYNPEFAKDSKGSIQESIEKTRVVIEKWQ